ncbi:MAG: hypothetical protein WC707_01880 [Candidatus Babeliaceae bacterium]|jgi:hypothetical protein
MKYPNRYILLSLLISQVTNCFDDHFFRASYFCWEPRFEEQFLTTAFATLGHGKTDTSRNACKQKSNLLDMYNTTIQPISNESPITYSTCGTFKLTELQLYYYQNIIKGFFLRLYFPMRRISVTNIARQTIMHAIPENPCIGDMIACAHIPGYKNTHAGDLYLLGGWTCNYEKTEFLDYIDITGQTGFMFPTSNTVNLDSHPYAVSSGNNGHAGFPIIFDLSAGLYEWITLGTHYDIVWLLNSQKYIENIQVYGKADHFCSGLSCIAGYSFACQRAAHQSNWSMHTLYGLIEFDWASFEHPNLPHIGFFYNHILAGKKIFDTSLVGGYTGVNISWCY